MEEILAIRSACLTLILSLSASAALNLKVESVTLPSPVTDPVESFFDVFFEITQPDFGRNPLAAYDFALDLMAPDSGVALGLPVNPADPHPPVFLAPPFDLRSTANRIQAQQFFSLGAEQTIDDGAGLGRIPFTVAPFTVGIFDLKIDMQSTLFLDGNINLIPFTAVNGTITIEAEEPTPGDLDGDGNVDLADFTIFAANFTGTVTPPEPPGTGGKTAGDGDTDDDGDVDFTDFVIFAAHFTGTATAPPSPAHTGHDSSEVELMIDLTDGSMKLIGNKVTLAGYLIRSASTTMVPFADDPDGAAPFQFFLLNMPNEVTAGSLSAGSLIEGELLLDIVWQGQSRDAILEYTLLGEVAPMMGSVLYMPEPTAGLLMIGGLVLLRRRKTRSGMSGIKG